MAVVFLDRDGTIIVDKNYLSDPNQIELLPHAAEALRILQRAGFTLVVLSNQSGIARGYFSHNDVHAMNRRMVNMLRAEGIDLPEHNIYFCPHIATDACQCRKPNIGMAERAQNDLGLDLSCTYVIGDKATDVELGLKLGATPILVKTGFGASEAPFVAGRAAYVADDLLDAANWILSPK